jgi:hypothetical protein
VLGVYLLAPEQADVLAQMTRAARRPHGEVFRLTVINDQYERLLSRWTGPATCVDRRLRIEAMEPTGAPAQ